MRILAVDTSWTALERRSLENIALALVLVGGLSSWTREEKDALVQIIRAKSARDEMKYLHLTEQHDRVRVALLGIGS
jgi:hypothetical protein